MQNETGQLSVDIFQEDQYIVIVAPIAGTSSKEVDISVTEEVLTIKGTRKQPYKIDEKDYLTKECFWGEFERSIVLPKNANTKEINAAFKDNVLEIRIPKTAEEKTKVVKINVD